MAREVLTQTDVKQRIESEATLGQSAAPATKDQYVDRLLKYIPAEVVALYIFVLGLLEGRAGSNVIHWIVFLVFCLLTFWYLWSVTNVRKIQQLIICVVAFIIWVFTLGGPFALLNWYDPLYGQILLPVYTFVIAIFEAKK
jgi:hypothetical protein